MITDNEQDKDNLQKLLTIHRRNLETLRIQSAKFGFDIPLRITNEIRDTEEKISQLLTEINDINAQDNLNVKPSKDSIKYRKMIYIDQDIVQGIFDTSYLEESNKLRHALYSMYEEAHKKDINESQTDINVDDIIKVRGKIRLTKILNIKRQADTVLELTNLVEKFQSINIPQKDEKSVQAISELARNLLKDKGIPVILSIAGESKLQILSYLNPNFLLLDINQIPAEVFIFGRVHHILKPKESIEIVNLDDLQPINRHQRRKAKYNPPPQFRDVVRFPAYTIVPFALYY